MNEDGSTAAVGDDAGEERRHGAPDACPCQGGGRQHRLSQCRFPEHPQEPLRRGSAYADIDGNLYDEHGNLVQKGANARKELSETADTNTPDHTHLETPARQPVLEGAGAGARGGSNIGDGIRPGDGLRDAAESATNYTTAASTTSLAAQPLATIHPPVATGRGPAAAAAPKDLSAVTATPRSGGDHVPSGSGADGPELGRSSDGAGETGTGYTPSHGGGLGRRRLGGAALRLRGGNLRHSAGNAQSHRHPRDGA
ncbi:hypothetical protein GCM10020227_27720 [Streptomyces flavovirens]